jgi:hypothetical protein
LRPREGDNLNKYKDFVKMAYEERRWFVILAFVIGFATFSSRVLLLILSLHSQV